MRALGYAALLIGIVAWTADAGAQSIMRNRGSSGAAQPNQSGLTPTQKEEKKFPLGMSWIAVSLNGKPLTGTERPSFALDEQFRVRGFGGCNSFSATAFPLKEQGIAVGPLAVTRRSCERDAMALEQTFLTTLRNSAKWDTVIGSLVIKGPNGEIKFERSL